jgi:hypothetical protein
VLNVDLSIRDFDGQAVVALYVALAGRDHLGLTDDDRSGESSPEADIAVTVTVA